MIYLSNSWIFLSSSIMALCRAISSSSLIFCLRITSSRAIGIYSGPSLKWSASLRCVLTEGFMITPFRSCKFIREKSRLMSSTRFEEKSPSKSTSLSVDSYGLKFLLGSLLTFEISLSWSNLGSLWLLSSAAPPSSVSSEGFSSLKPSWRTWRACHLARRRYPFVVIA